MASPAQPWFGLGCAVLLIGCAPRGPAAAALLPCAESDGRRVPMQGVFVIEYGDPATNRERGSVRYLLAGDQGNVTVLLVEPHLLDELGPPTALHGRRVSITANSSGKDTLQVCTLRFAAEARSR